MASVAPVPPREGGWRTGRLSIWMVLGGVIELRAGGYRRTCWQGETVLVPASFRGASWHPEGMKPLATVPLLGITLP